MYNIPAKISVSPLRAIYSLNNSEALFVGSSRKYDNAKQVVYSVGKDNPLARFDDCDRWLLTDEYEKAVKGILLTRNASRPVAVKPKRNKRADGYKLNKTKLREKCAAYAELNRSRKFMAFYSISFPLGTTEKDAVKAFNTWRTRCARDFGLVSFIRVCEHQKNGTIHFHMLTNCYLPIQKINRALAVTLDNSGLLHDQCGNRMSVSQYNGVDVKRVYNVRGVNRYLSKYIAKGLDEFHILPCHWSRDVSALFTRVNVDYEEKYDLRGDDRVYTVENDWCEVVYHHGVIPTGCLLFNLRRLNNILFDRYVELCRKKDYYSDNCYVRNNLGYNRTLFTFDKAIQAAAKSLKFPSQSVEDCFGELVPSENLTLSCPF